MVDFSKYGTPITPEKKSVDFSKYGTPLQTPITAQEPKPERGFFASTVPDTGETPAGLRALDFLSQGTQAFGKTIGQASQAERNAKLFEESARHHSEIANNLASLIKEKKKKGEDTSMLQRTLTQHLQEMPQLRQFTGDVIDKTGRQVVGEGIMAGLEATSGGILSSGVKSVTAKAIPLSQRLLQGAGVGSIYGAIGGGAGAMQENASLGEIVGSTAVGGLAGGLLGAGLAGGGALAGKSLSALEKTALANKILPMTESRINKVETWVKDSRKAVADVYEKSLPLTPTQKIKEANLLTKTGDNLYTTLSKYNINGGSEEATSQLQQVSDKFRNAINQAKANENNPFNLDEMLINADKQITERISSETARATARKKIEDEVNLLLKNNKGAVSLNDKGQRIVDSSIMERLRDTGNGWTPFNASDPEKVGQSTGYALANAVRDQVEKEGTFPAYREANREWGKVIHAQEMLQKIADSGKQFRVLGGLSGSVSRKVLSGLLGYHTGGIAGAIISEIGSEYGAKILSNPSLRTYLDRKIIERFANTKATPEAVAKLEAEVRAYIDANVERPVLIKSLPKTGTAEMGTYPLRTNDATGRVEVGSPEVKGLDTTEPKTTSMEMGSYKLGKNAQGQVDLTGQYRNPEQNFYNQVEAKPTATPINKQSSNSISESIPSKSKPVNTQGGFISTGYKETGNLTTKILKKLEGRETVSKQFISDLTNSGDLKQVERDIIRGALEGEKDVVNVKQFADKVKQELLPLEKTINNNPRYENITLPDEVRGGVKDYNEHIYESPIKTSAGNTHFNGEDMNNYFGHTRIEDMADNKTRRVIEVQSDLYQKGNLDRELPYPQLKGGKGIDKTIEETNAMVKSGRMTREEADRMVNIEKKAYENQKPREQELAKLAQYNDPTAHFRMIREEMAQAAKDGKTKLQFPTGETAMKIEGLGESTNWNEGPFAYVSENSKLTPTSLKVGKIVNDNHSDWIITDVLGEGKFKAISSEKVDNTLRSIGVKLENPADKLSYMEQHHQNTIDYYAEEFDISGKVDTSNPIYKFYNKDVANYLKKFGGKQITDNNGVSWIEVPITKDMGGAVEAFGKTNPNILLKGALVGAGLAGAAGTVAYAGEKPKQTIATTTKALGDEMDKATKKVSTTTGVKFPPNFLKAIREQESSNITDKSNLRLSMGITDSAMEDLGKKAKPNTSIANIMENAANYLAMRSQALINGKKVDFTRPENIIKWYVQRYVGLLPGQTRKINGEDVPYQKIYDSFEGILDRLNNVKK